MKKDENKKKYAFKLSSRAQIICTSGFLKERMRIYVTKWRSRARNWNFSTKVKNGFRKDMQFARQDEINHWIIYCESACEVARLDENLWFPWIMPLNRLAELKSGETQLGRNHIFVHSSQESSIDDPQRPWSILFIIDTCHPFCIDPNSNTFNDITITLCSDVLSQFSFLHDNSLLSNTQTAPISTQI